MNQLSLVFAFSLALCLANSSRVEPVSSKFVNSVKQFRAPLLEQQLRYGNFFEDFGRNVGHLMNEVTAELYRQVRFQSNVLGNSLTSIRDQLEFEMTENRTAGYSEYLDKLLGKLNGHMERYLELNPDSLTVPRKTLGTSELEEHRILKSYLSYHTLKELFSNLESIVDTHLANIHILVNRIYTEGWKAARTGLPELQQQFREDFINGYLSPVFNNILNSVYKNAEKIKESVKQDTWRQFEACGSRIRALR